MQLGVIERNAVADRPTVFLGLQPLDVGVWQPGQLPARDLNRVLVIVDVAAELNAQPHQPLVQVAHHIPFLSRQFEAVAAVVAQREFEQPRRIGRQRLRLRARRVGLERAVELLAEAETGRKHIEPLLLLVRGFPQISVCGDLRKEAEAPVRLPDQVADLVERKHRVLERPRPIRHRCDRINPPLRLINGLGNPAADVLSVGRVPVRRQNFGHGVAPRREGRGRE